MAKKKWYQAYAITEKTIFVYATDEDEAREKAENKLGISWSIESVHEVKHG